MRAFREFIVFVIEFEVISIGRQFRCVCRTANCVKVVQIQINHSFGGNCCDSPLMRVIILREIGLIVRASQEVIIVLFPLNQGLAASSRTRDIRANAAPDVGMR